MDRDKMAQSIVSGIPVTQQAKARRIVDAMKANPNVVTWNSDWELVHNGVPVPNTNVVDLVNDLVRSKKNFNPLGAPQILQGLKKINFPSAYIGNDDRRQQMMSPGAAAAVTPPKTQKTAPTLVTPKKWKPY